nr:mismatch repair protein MutS2 [Candidatus Cloacimonadota bacterium]
MTDLEYSSFLKHLADRCHSALGKARAQKLGVLSNIEEMRASQKLISEFQVALEEGVDFDLSTLTNLEPYFKEPIHGIYDWEEFREISINAELATNFHEHLTAFEELPEAYKVVKKLHPLPQIRQAFERIYDPEGDVKDSASQNLTRIRKALSSLRSRIQHSMQNLLNEPRFEGYLQDKYVTQRDDRFVLPIKESAATFVSGIVQSRSGSKSTVFIEPEQIVPLNNEMQLLREEEKREIYQILSDFSTEIRMHRRELLENQALLIELDFLYGAARISNDLRAKVPKMHSAPSLDLRAARHPLLILKMIAEEGTNAYHKVIPFDLSLGEDYHLMILSGPNTGGKTVLMKAVGLISLMALSGLPIPADEDSRVGYFSKIYADIGDDQSIENALSTFSSHLDKIGKMLREADSQSLILIDEIGAATDPQQGSALAQAILEKLVDLGVKGIVTTHYTALKVFAESNDSCINASMQFDTKSLLPTYRFSTGIPGDSFAIEVAASLGLDPDLIARARSLAGSQNVEFSSLIKRLQEQKKTLGKEIYQYELKRRNLEAKLQEIDSKEIEWEKELKARRQKHLKEMQTELISFQKLYSKEINEIKSLQKDQRKKVSERKLQDIAKQSEDLSRQIKIHSAEGREKLAQPKTGDRVWLADFEADATIITIDKEQAVVDMNGISFKTRLNNLYKSSADVPNLEKQVPLAKTHAAARVQTELKLLGLTFDEAIPLIDEFLDNAQLNGFSTLRIVHGKGTGALRAKVRDYLSRKKIVKSIETPPLFEGGSGVTVVKI